MRNLRNTHLGIWEAGPQENIGAICWDPDRDGDALCITRRSPVDPTTRLVRVREQLYNVYEQHVVAAWDGANLGSGTHDGILSLHHDNLTTTIILAGGDILTVEERDGADARVEILGTMDEGISAASWSPDGEIVAITTKTNTLHLMGRAFDSVVPEILMTTDDLAVSKHVSVGWGSKETQFHGRGAKAMRDPTIPEKIDEGVLSPRDDAMTTISWRGDGAYLAVNSIEGKRRVIRIYTRDGVLDGVSEPVDGLEGSLSWRPSGNLMAGVQRLAEKIDVVFFERNGLRHGQFTLRADDIQHESFERIRLAWNSDSTVLAVTLADRVQLWTTGNYHWYLKQELQIPPGPANLAWHPEKALKLSVTSSSRALLIEYIFTSSRGSCVPPHDFGLVGVIDGKTLKATPFRTANIPPPMALFDIEAPSPIVDIAFGSKNAAIAILHGRGVDIHEFEIKDGRCFGSKLIRQISLLDICHEKTAPIGRQISFSQDSQLHILFGLGYGPQLYSVNIQGGPIVAEVCPIDFRGDISLSSIEAGNEPSKGFLQHNAGTILRLHGPDTSAAETSLPGFFPWFEGIGSHIGATAVGLSKRGHLNAGTRLLAKNCTSFMTTPEYLIYTTTNHFIKFVHLGGELEIPPDDPHDERCRNIERGARLITAIPARMCLVLQMPRGNLETIYPRAMVVAGIRQHIDAKNYREAFMHCRTQRVDMNILYDYKPAQFIENVHLFLQQITDAAHVDLFLSSIKDEDVTLSTYRDTKHAMGQGAETEGAALPPGSKINRICDAILTGLGERPATNLQNIITANVCKVPPALEDGLRIVSNLMQEDETVAEKAVEHICFLVDVNRLYDTALGLYNLDLALLVAQQSQRDPREYLPFIQNLHSLPELRRQFTIDDHLKRRDKAVTHLKALDAFEELKGYTVKYDLYKDALKMFKYDESRLTVLTQLYAAHLESQSKFKDAGLAYEWLQDFSKATLCYKAAGASYWRECLGAAYQQHPPLSEIALNEIATSLAEALVEAKEYTSAAQIYLEYLSSVETAVSYFCKGYHFDEAIRIVVLRRRPELLTSAVDAGLADALSNTTEFLADCKGQLQAQIPRILELRRKATDDPLAFYEGERPGGDNLLDDISIAPSSNVSTSASMFTRYTGKGSKAGDSVATGTSRATSKKRAREEKKRARGRKGTIYEEEYLVNSVRRLVERVGSARSEVQSLVTGLVRRSMAERARAVEGFMEEVVAACKASVIEVFGSLGDSKELGPTQIDALSSGENEYKAVGGEAVFLDFIEAKSRRQEPPVVPGFEKLALLG